VSVGKKEIKAKEQMGKLSKAFGFGDKGKIGLKVDKASYIAGELVTGTVYITVNEPLRCDSKFFFFFFFFFFFPNALGVCLSIFLLCRGSHESKW